MTSKFPSGSEWRKWDLHVHTRLDHNYHFLGVDGLSSEQLTTLATTSGLSTADITSREREIGATNYSKLFVAYLDHYTDVDVVGITNHNTGEELDQLIAAASASRRQVTILPGVEISSNQGIHLLCLFDPDKPWFSTWQDTIEHLLTEVGVPSQRFNAQAQPVNSSKSCQDILDIVCNRGGICVFAHITTDNGLFKQSATANGGTAHADIYKHKHCTIVQLPQAGIVGSGVQNIIKGRDPFYGNKVVAQIKCSDARKLTDIGLVFSWIKANPTFAGLVQVIYEPLTRITLSATSPENKKPYRLIKEVRFLDNTGEVNFSADSIHINPDLTTLIGGKSTGKSLLLHYVAKTIDKEEVAKRLLDVDQVEAYSFEDNAAFDFEVTWADGTVSTLRQKALATGEQPQARKILYIPQRYLNGLTERNIRSREALNSFVLNVLIQDDAVRADYETTLDKIAGLEKEISSEISSVFILESEAKKLEEDLKQLGDLAGIQSYINTVEEEIKLITTQSGLSSEEVTQYYEASKEEKRLKTVQLGLSEDRKTIERLQRYLEAHAGEVAQTLEENLAKLNNDDIRDFSTEQLRVFVDLATTIVPSIKRITGEIDRRSKEVVEELSTLAVRLSPLVAKLTLQTTLEQKKLALDQEREKVDKINSAQKTLQVKKKSYIARRKALLTKYETIFSNYEHMAKEFKKYESHFEDIAISVTVGFDEERFGQMVVGEYLNKPDLKKVAGYPWKDEFQYKYDPVKHGKVIGGVLEGLLDGNIKTLRGRQAKEAIAQLLANYFMLNFAIAYKNDPLDKMSPGKKGLVLLRLLIELSNEDWPILLDQPEDDLDNRSVYTDLVSFIRTKKAHRQMLIVTHNPNLVVGADSEEVIVANQEGQEPGRENRKYRFEYVSGALEDSFELDPALEKAILFQKGIREHVCEVLEGGKEAFQKREQRYGFN